MVRMLVPNALEKRPRIRYAVHVGHHGGSGHDKRDGNSCLWAISHFGDIVHKFDVQKMVNCLVVHEGCKKSSP
jgi:hypothetical protein